MLIRSGSRRLVLAAGLTLGSLVALAMLTAGCIYLLSRGHWYQAHAPIALHELPDGRIEVLYVPCDDPDQKSSYFRRSQISGFTLRAVWSNDGETVWRLDFAQPRSLDSLVLGEVPEGATEVVQWPEDGLDSYGEDTEFRVWFHLEDAYEGDEVFRLEELSGGRVRWRGDYVTPDEFAEADGCEF